LENPDDGQGVSTRCGNGEGVVQDYAAAVKWYTLAAEQGDAEAQNNLAIMYNNGEGVLQDYALAHMWANIAAANGAEHGSKNRDIIAQKLSQTEITSAQKLAKKMHGKQL